jgi:NADPH:quinone reductase-like Zn-dependent oxidoreductase
VSSLLKAVKEGTLLRLGGREQAVEMLQRDQSLFSSSNCSFMLFCPIWRGIMKAVVVHPYGDPEVLKFEEYPDPVPGPGEVPVRVAATSVNPIDYQRRAGLTKDFYPMTFPGRIGTDIAGTVVKVRPGVEDFSAGGRVFAMAANTYAELCVVKADILVRIPKGLDLIQVAALPLVTTTGNELVSATEIKAGQTVSWPKRCEMAS